VYEIERSPRVLVYQEHARKRGITLAPATRASTLIANELGIIVAGKVTRARRAALGGCGGSLSCAAEVPQGAHVAILDGKPERDGPLPRGKAAAEALQNPAGARSRRAYWLFDCVCRGPDPQGRVPARVDAVREVMGEVPVAGFLTYGEIAS